MVNVPVKYTHNFVEKTYHRWTFCDHCNKVLWGLVKQGEECTECGFISHRKCLDDLTFVCDHRLRNRDTLSASDDNTSNRFVHTSFTEQKTSSSSVASQMDVERETGTLSDGELPTATSSDGTRKRSLYHNYASDQETSGNQQSSKHGHNPSNTSSSGSLFQDLITSTVANQMVIQRSLESAPLDLLTLMPKNTQKFIQRAGVLGAAENAVKYVITWQSTSTTLLCMIGYAVLCFYPILITILPHLAVIHLIIHNYFKRAQEIARIRSGRPKPEQTKSRMLGGLSPVPATTITEYKANMQYIQNFMGVFIDTYDEVAAQLHHFDWSDPQHTTDVFKLMLVAMFATLAVVAIVPTHWLMLIAGEAVFIANSAIVKAFADVVLPHILQYVNKYKPSEKSAPASSVSNTSTSKPSTLSTTNSASRGSSKKSQLPSLINPIVERPPSKNKFTQ